MAGIPIGPELALRAWREWSDAQPGLPLPRALYPCSEDVCAETYSWRPEDLKWWPGGRISTDPAVLETRPAGWYCPECSSFWDLEYEPDRWGPTLAEELARRAT